MALIKSPGCGKDVSANAVACPSCGELIDIGIKCPKCGSKNINEAERKTFRRFGIIP